MAAEWAVTPGWCPSMTRERSVTDVLELPTAEHSPSLATTIIRPSSGWSTLRLRELWDYRELIYFLIWSGLKIRYKQTIMGAAWAIMQPFFTMVVFSIFFGRLAGISSGDVPYPVFAYCALVPWTYFANALSDSGNSLLQYQGVITKVYFPRLIIPIASILGGLVDGFIAFVVLLGMLLVYGIVPSFNLLLLPLFVLLASISALGTGCLLSALNVQYRDVRYVIPFLIQIWLFCTPIAYPSSLVPQRWRPLYGLNPMVGVTEGFRWALLGESKSLGVPFVASVLAALGMLIIGLLYFRRVERTFADVV